MANAKIKTTENANSVLDFVKSVPDERRQKDTLAIIEIMKKESGFEPKMWGPAIIGFGSYHYKYESGREGDMPLVAFSPRKAELTLYLSSEFEDRAALLKELGKHKTSKACLYIKRITDINVEVLRKMISQSLKYTKAKYK